MIELTLWVLWGLRASVDVLLIIGVGSIVSGLGIVHISTVPIVFGRRVLVRPRRFLARTRRSCGGSRFVCKGLVPEFSWIEGLVGRMQSGIVVDILPSP